VIELDARAHLPPRDERPRLWAPIGRRLLDLVSSPLPLEARYWNGARPLVDAFREVRHSARFDTVWVDRAHFAELVHRAGFERFVVDVDDCESVVFARELEHSPWYRSKVFHYAELGKLYLYERSLARRFWRLVVCKAEDRRLLGSCRRNVFVVPNGIPDYPAAPAENEAAGELFFIGAMDFVPNVDAVRFFAGAVFPAVRRACADATFHVVGKNPDPAVQALHDGVACFVHGYVPDINPCYERAAVVVAPVRLGSGTRVKVLEALGRGKALVATPTAVEGLDLRPGVDFEMAAHPEELAGRCARLLGDPTARRKLGTAGRQRVQDRYRWERIGAIAERVLTP
jgi:glycosyltransferase involved in cell wall biosynthesis